MLLEARKFEIRVENEHSRLALSGQGCWKLKIETCQKRQDRGEVEVAFSRHNDISASRSCTSRSRSYWGALSATADRGLNKTSIRRTLRTISVFYFHPPHTRRRRHRRGASECTCLRESFFAAVTPFFSKKHYQRRVQGTMGALLIMSSLMTWIPASSTKTSSLASGS
jgi:hypothetical protein